MLDVDSKPLEAKNKLLLIVPIAVLLATVGAVGYILYFLLLL